jgi:sec-independent protein translocase protein TatC
MRHSSGFLLGISFGYWFVIPYGYKFLLEFGGGSERPMLTMVEYFSITFQLLLAMGLIFELPVVMMLLGKFGIVDAKMLVKWRSHAFIGLSVVAAIVTPTPDAFTLLLVMFPLWGLYELSIWLVRWVSKPSASE